VSELYKRKPNAQCCICSKQVYRRPVEIERNNGKVYCSSRCYGVACRKEKPCVICGKAILAGLNKKTCSRACANKNRVGIKYKVGSPKDKVRSLKALRKRVESEYGTACVRCGYNKTSILQIHHRDKDHYNNNIKNLELLCPNCHAEIHLLKK